MKNLLALALLVFVIVACDDDREYELSRKNMQKALAGRTLSLYENPADASTFSLFVFSYHGTTCSYASSKSGILVSSNEFDCEYHKDNVLLYDPDSDNLRFSIIHKAGSYYLRKSNDQGTVPLILE